MNSAPIKNVLVIEDDPMVRRLLARHFQKRGIIIVEAADAEEAVRKFGEPGASFDVVVTDVHLPGMSGLDLATRIRALRPDQPIVFVTGDVDEELARKALESGGAGYLLKPFEFFELDAAISQAVGAAPPQAAAPTPRPAPASDLDAWMAEQRRILQAAAARPVDLGTSSRPTYVRPSRLPLFAKIAATVVVLLILAWVIGYGIFPEHKQPPQVDPLESPQDQRTIYVPYDPQPGRQPQRNQGR